MIEYTHTYIYIYLCVATWKLQHQTTVSCSSTPHFSIGAYFWDGRISPAIGSKRWKFPWVFHGLFILFLQVPSRSWPFPAQRQEKKGDPQNRPTCQASEISIKYCSRYSGHFISKRGPKQRRLRTVGRWRWWWWPTVRKLNIAMENGPCVEGFTHRRWWFSIAILNFQRVTGKNVGKWRLNPETLWFMGIAKLVSI